MNNVDNQYLNLLRDVLENGCDKNDRTGTGTRSVFGRQMRFNLQEGYPLLTTKKVHFKSVAHELLWMYINGSTSNQDLMDHGVTIWKEWQNDKQELPFIYGKQITRRNGDKRVIEVPIRKQFFQPYIYAIEKNYEVENKKIYKNRDGCDFIVIDTFSHNNKGYSKVIFLNTGTVIEKVRNDIVLNGQIKDKFHPSVFSVGFLGNIELSTPEIKKLYRVWQGIIDRCYNTQHVGYKNYGGQGIFVQGRWHCFANFYEDVQKIPNWQEKKNNWDGYSLDKDYYGSNCYSKETTVWLSNCEQQLYRKNNIPFKVLYPNGVAEIFIEQNHCCDKIGITKSDLYRRLNSTEINFKKFKDFEFKFQLDNPTVLYRYKLPINQLELLVQDIKDSPESRRLIIDAWNVWDLEVQALPACHSFVQFNITNNKLNCCFYMRSVDVFLGLPFNIASYALLTHMIAHICQLEVGDLIWTGGDVHIYKNHFDQVKMQLERTPYPSLPNLIIDNNVTDIKDFKYSDFSIEGYKSHGSIKAPIAI